MNAEILKILEKYATDRQFQKETLLIAFISKYVIMVESPFGVAYRISKNAPIEDGYCITLKQDNEGVIMEWHKERAKILIGCKPYTMVRIETKRGQHVRQYNKDLDFFDTGIIIGHYYDSNGYRNTHSIDFCDILNIAIESEG